MSVLRSLAFGLSLALSSAALVSAPGAFAGEGETAKIDPILEQQFEPCSAGSWTKVRVTSDGQGTLEAVGVVFGDGEDIWSWKLKHDDDFSARGRVLAKEREVDRSFRVVREMVDFQGPDKVTFRAVNETTNELCIASLTFTEDYGRTHLRPRPPS
ncbi:MAG: hypothetical protein M3237_01010 [Actinomycetota bacterium]|nr:hypothetical protein [Actinomycetota bacterium]